MELFVVIFHWIITRCDKFINICYDHESSILSILQSNIQKCWRKQYKQLLCMEERVINTFQVKCLLCSFVRIRACIAFQLADTVQNFCFLWRIYGLRGISRLDNSIIYWLSFNVHIFVVRLEKAVTSGSRFDKVFKWDVSLL